MSPNPKKKIEIISFDDIVNATVLSVSAATIATTFENDIKSTHKVIKRTRKRIDVIFRELGPRYIRRAYRMEESSFWKLLDLIKINVNLEIKKSSAIPNGKILLSAKLSMALRWFAGGSSYDIALYHGVHYQETMKSVWTIVDLVNLCEKIKIQFPSTHTEQEKVANGFKKKSWVQFDNCTGCVDGMLVWITKPSKNSMSESRIGAAKFFCGRKKKFGLNLQAICDHKCRFLDVDISHPASTSDYLAFCTSSILVDLEKENFLKPGLCLYGDNAYVNTSFMASPFKGTSSGPKDACNFFQSQIRINIECAFGILVSRWGVLRKAIPGNISIQKICSLVRCLCILHNFCINEHAEEDDIDLSFNEIDNFVPGSSTTDSTNITIAGGFDLSNRLEELLDGGQHFDDTTHQFRSSRLDNTQESNLPRTKMLEKVIDKGYEERPNPRTF